MENLMKNKVLMIGVVVVVLVILGGVAMMHSSKSKQADQTQNVLPEGDVVPTVDSSVVVNLEAETGNKEVVLTVKNAPEGTTSVEYELSYLAKGDIPKGVIGTIPMESSKDIERKITLGTCSSGVCNYDQGVTSIKVSLKFNGSYGARSFEKEFPL